MSADLLSAPAAAAALLLGVAGVAKVVRPHDTARALRQAGLAVPPVVVRLGAAAEAGLAAVALVTGHGVPALAVGASYLALAAFVAVALVRRLPLATCGCFGEPDTPPTALHVVVDLVAAGMVLAAAAAQAPPLWQVVADSPGQGAVLVVLAVITAGLTYLALAELPRLRAAGSVVQGGRR